MWHEGQPDCQGACGVIYADRHGLSAFSATQTAGKWLPLCQFDGRNDTQLMQLSMGSLDQAEKQLLFPIILKQLRLIHAFQGGSGSLPTTELISVPDQRFSRVEQRLDSVVALIQRLSNSIK